MERLLRYLEDMYTCARAFCGFCVYECPAYHAYRSEAYTSRGRMLLLTSMIRGLVDYSSVAKVMFRCTLCGWCELHCALGNTEIFRSARALLIDRGVAPHEVVEALRLLETYGSVYGDIAGVKAGWAEGLELRGDSEVLLYAGCTYAYLGYHRPLRRAALLLKAMGLEPSTLGGEEPCCGYPYYLLGLDERLEEHARRVVRFFRERGYRKLITLCPACALTFRDVYPRLVEGFDLEVYHVAEILARRLNRLPLGRLNITVAFHDPCKLARGLRVFEEPRLVMDNIGGLELLEPPVFKGLLTRCCGGGGLLPLVDPEGYVTIAKRRLAELVGQGPELLVTSCPACLRTLDLTARIMDLEVRVHDLVDLVYEAAFQAKPPQPRKA